MRTVEYGYAIYDEDGEWVGHVNTREQVERVMSQNPGYDYEPLDKESYEEMYLNKSWK